WPWPQLTLSRGRGRRAGRVKGGDCPLAVASADLIPWERSARRPGEGGRLPERESFSHVFIAATAQPVASLLTQTRIDLVEHGRPGAEILGFQPIERRINRVEVVV